MKVFQRVLKKIFSARNERLLRSMGTAVAHMNRLEPELQKLSDAALREKTAQFRGAVEQGASLDQLLPETFAVVREAARRSLRMRHFDVQLLGGMALHRGFIAEMLTGEGKTLVATLAAYLNALAGKGVHVVTVNDYLARRDAEWMGRVYLALGMNVGVIVPDMNSAARREAYAADVTYGTNNEFGFDYLRDNMALHRSHRVQRDLHYAIVDEVDSILIDEARTPLVISGSMGEETQIYVEINRLIPKLNKADYSIEEKSKQVYLSEAGHAHVETLLTGGGLMSKDQSLYNAGNLALMHYLNACLRSHLIFKRDVDYIVKDNQISIVDQFTGRALSGRRWSDGLHQAIEAKENVTIQQESHNLASITFQNYFRLYGKLAGMTGTAITEKHEFQQIYGLDVMQIPPHRKMIRQDLSDLVYQTTADKFAAIIEDIKESKGAGQPVLVGTTSIEVSEHISDLLRKDHIAHQVLNAKFHAREAEIIAQAGGPGTVTIATNMAGRGTDIVLGGNPEAEIHALEGPSEEQETQVRQDWRKRYEQVLAQGGLHIIGTERHESRRIDNQLRGRSGRQGDPGSTRFYLSLEDSLMRIFASERVSGFIQKQMAHGEALEHPWLNKSIESAQRKVEEHNFDIRKHLLQYDDIVSEQRKVIYDLRNEILEATDTENIFATLRDMRGDVVDSVVESYIPADSVIETWDVSGLGTALKGEFGLEINVQDWLDESESISAEQIRNRVHECVEAFISSREAVLSASVLRDIEQQLLLDAVDRHWRAHLQGLDYLRQGIGLRGFAAKNPQQEFKKEAFSMFMEMLDRIKHDVTVLTVRMHVHPVEGRQDDRAAVAPAAPREQKREPGRQPARSRVSAVHPPQPNPLQPRSASPAAPRAVVPYVRRQKKIGRNQPCPCGSGKKYKHCHGDNTDQQRLG